ncbi:hypothetical protein PHLGIDRAFT_161154 [Phlebiopsis gigantea 11061_1 CR5-6]|uniref:Transmembrane protein n=1 Tax=Phlebiopsis gigantea (strain 11061_1 CR5-6) TaxID=745531 RepID=A0A0C3S8F9_PHLG1|nr:hypothetical protein PHLGIDRAFT_161154 [Phlebiopsis gigantea 11061_1 CR5-6]
MVLSNHFSPLRPLHIKNMYTTGMIGVGGIYWRIATIAGVLDRHVRKVRRWHWAVQVLAITCAAAGCGVGLGWAFRTQALDSAPPSLYPGRQVQMELTVLDVDPLTGGGMITISWDILNDTCVDNSTTLNWNASVSPYDLSCSEVNIFMDQNLFAGSRDPNTTTSTGVPTIPIFQWIPRTFRNTVLANTPTFQTDISIWSKLTGPRGSLVNYPFDVYAGELWLYARTLDTNASVGLNVSQTAGIAFGFDTYIVPRQDLLKALNIDGSFIADVNEELGTLDLYLVIRRTTLVKVYVLILVVAMWVITLLLLGIAAKAVLYGFQVESTVLVVPVATLFAFTTLRSSMPGSPSAFGAYIDFAGTLPSLALLVTVTVICLIHTLFQQNDLRHAPSQGTSHTAYAVTSIGRTSCHV